MRASGTRSCITMRLAGTLGRDPALRGSAAGRAGCRRSSARPSPSPWRRRCRRRARASRCSARSTSRTTSTSSSVAAFRSSIEPMTSHEYGWPGGNRFVTIVSNTLPYGSLSPWRFSFCTTPRCSSSFVLVDRAEQVPHAVRLEPQREIERGGRHRLEVVRAVEVRRAVHARRADFLRTARK